LLPLYHRQSGIMVPPVSLVHDAATVRDWHDF